ncbi:hypothetical protein COHA_000246 [Chlorella ohadii]|uniref:DNL-type domain-containing protein n=1 Tax=Chlorella ohadii TaxID=2649997 RepID=A0AAD5E025_9CHLO|nr:hypothetical protein COHA_000246 [Chlorella ohadii]
MTSCEACRPHSADVYLGLSEALSAEATAIGRRQLQQPWVLTSLRAHGGSGSGDAAGEQQQGGSSPALALGDAAAGSSSQAGAEAAAAPRQRPPPGHTDFEQRQLLMVFTCSKCNTRAAKAFSKKAYESGVVIVECPGCQSRHLIADHLGWFGQKGTVEQFAAERGQMVLRKATDGTVELTPEDLLGPSLVAEAEAAVKGGGSGGSDGSKSGSGSGAAAGAGP